MSIMNFNNIEASGKCALERSNPSFLQVFNVIFCHLFRFSVVFIPWKGAWPVNIVRPAIDLPIR